MHATNHAPFIPFPVPIPNLCKISRKILTADPLVPC